MQNKEYREKKSTFTKNSSLIIKHLKPTRVYWEKLFTYLLSGRCKQGRRYGSTNQLCSVGGGGASRDTPPSGTRNTTRMNIWLCCIRQMRRVNCQKNKCQND